MLNAFKKKLKAYDIDEIINEIGISKPTFYRWINGEGIENNIKFIKLIELLEITPEELIASAKNKLD